MTLWKSSNWLLLHGSSFIILNFKTSFHIIYNLTRIGTSSRSSLIKKGAPGPGTYPIGSKITKEGPKYPFGIKLGVSTRDKFPGPGAYEDYYRTTVKGTPYYSFGLKPGAQSRLASPGPGTYDPNKSSSVINIPSSL